MTPLAITFLVISLGVVWGGLIASAVALRLRTERADFPPGGEDDERADAGPIVHDT